LHAKIENPLNRIIVEDRKRRKYGKATGVLSAVLGCSLLVIALTSRNAVQNLETLFDGRVAGSTLLAFDLAGAAFALLTGFLLLKYKHFSKVSFSISCIFAIFFGLNLILMQVVHSPSSVISVVGIEGAFALAVSLAVMALSIFSA
jgi:hypothetical protein